MSSAHYSTNTLINKKFSFINQAQCKKVFWFVKNIFRHFREGGNDEKKIIVRASFLASKKIIYLSAR